MSVVSTPTGYTIRYDANASGFAFSGRQLIPTIALKPEFDYVVWLSGTGYQALNTLTGFVQYSGTDFSTVVQAIIDDNSTSGVVVGFTRQTFTVESPISIPVTNGHGFRFKGVGYRRNISTNFQVGSSFPSSGRYMFEHIGVANNTTDGSCVEFKNIHFGNLNNFTTIPAGGVRYESDDARQFQPFVMENCETNLLARGVHIVGRVYWGIIRDCTFGTYGTPTFSGEFDLMVERDYYGWDNAALLASSGTPVHTDYAKGWHFENIEIQHNSEYMKYAISFEGAHSKFFNINIDGDSFERPFVFKAHAWSNRVWGLRMQDLNAAPPGSGHVASLVFDASGTFTSGYAARQDTSGASYTITSGGNLMTVYGNHVYGGLFGLYPANVAFLGSGFRNYAEVVHYGGNDVIVNDLNAGANNVVRVLPSERGSLVDDRVVVCSGGRVTIQDDRAHARGRGSFIDSGNASKTVYTIPHGLFANPMTSGYVNIQPASKQARASGGLDISGDATNIYVTFGAAPSSGTVRLMWEANIYPG